MNKILSFAASSLFFFAQLLVSQPQAIRVNQLGYLPNDRKCAVFLSKDQDIISFTLCDALTGEQVFSSANAVAFPAYGQFLKAFRLDFTSFHESGSFYMQAGIIRSPIFRIGADIYNGTADFLLQYMRQQRSGYNPMLRDSCHVNDGFIMYHPTLDSTHIDVSGGWHDASDYLQYTATSANAVYQMLFAYQQNPAAFGDRYDAAGLPGANGIPDILDEAKWGLDWLVKMNPQKGMMFNQIADDRDHRGFRLPTLDTVSYGRGRERPVYFCTGKPQGIYQHKNRSTGIASTAGKFASAFSLGGIVLKKYYPEFSRMLSAKAADAYNFGKENPGVCQTAPCRSPYFYEEGNWADDMELAAAQLYLTTGNKNYLDEAAAFGVREPVTPWMGADTARHYEWYPFVNLGHFLLAGQNEKRISEQFKSYLKKGLDTLWQKARKNVFFCGVPFIWCSNNLASALISQASLYRKLTNDESYSPMETAMRDWLFGCNPWGTSMIVGLPPDADTPVDPHSAFSAVHKIGIPGGLIDGPVYGNIFKNLIGIKLYGGDEYADWQSGNAVYHDDYGDYSTNEPTMDGTASLTYYLGSLASSEQVTGGRTIDHGGVVRMDSVKKKIFLVFTGHEFADGGDAIAAALKKHSVKGSFFFTGDFYRNDKFSSLIKELKKRSNYLGAHSDKHLLYAPWERRDSLLVSKEMFLSDVRANYDVMKKFGIDKKSARWFMPPFEWYNDSVSAWAGEIGIQLVNFTAGTYSNADYTTPDMGAKYLSSDSITARIFRFEKNNRNGLNGCLLLIHIGTDPRRTDKLYLRLDGIIAALKKMGYAFGDLSEEEPLNCGRWKIVH